MTVAFVPGGPSIPIYTIITAVNDRHETAEVAAAFNKAVAAGFIPQLIARLKQVQSSPCQPSMHSVCSCVCMLSFERSTIYALEKNKQMQHPGILVVLQILECKHVLQHFCMH